MTAQIIVRPVEEADYEQWKILFEGYREFYNFERSQTVVDTVWSWLFDENSPMRGIVATYQSTVVGMGHVRTFLRPATASQGLWLDDLFVHPEYRGLGVARALISYLEAMAREETRSSIRWITGDTNYPARMLYDSLAKLTNWRVYELEVD